MVYLRRRCRLEDVMKILRRRGDEDDTRRCVDDDGADAEILRRVDVRILQRRCRDGDPTTTMLTRESCDDVDVEQSLVVVE